MLDVTGTRCGPCAEPMALDGSRHVVVDVPALPAPVCPACGDERCLTHCVWCRVDCDIDDPPHLPYCPQRTGLFPAPAGACCVVCGDPMTVYVSRIDLEHDDVELAVCVGCAATDRPEEP